MVRPFKVAVCLPAVSAEEDMIAGCKTGGGFAGLCGLGSEEQSERLARIAFQYEVA
jgi:hypothetical protein